MIIPSPAELAALVEAIDRLTDASKIKDHVDQAYALAQRASLLSLFARLTRTRVIDGPQVLNQRLQSARELALWIQPIVPSGHLTPMMMRDKIHECVSALVESRKSLDRPTDLADVNVRSDVAANVAQAFALELEKDGE